MSFSSSYVYARYSHESSRSCRRVVRRVRERMRSHRSETSASLCRVSFSAFIPVAIVRMQINRSRFGGLRSGETKDKIDRISCTLFLLRFTRTIDQRRTPSAHSSLTSTNVLATTTQPPNKRLDTVKVNVSSISNSPNRLDPRNGLSCSVMIGGSRMKDRESI